MRTAPPTDSGHVFSKMPHPRMRRSRRCSTRSANASSASCASAGISIVTEGNVLPGQTRYYQFWFRDGNGIGACGFASNLTNGLEVNWQ